MGNYVMRVKPAPKKLADGTKVHESVYAYKPSWGDWRWNDEQERKRLGPAIRAWARKSEDERSGVMILDGSAAPGSPVYRLEYCFGSYNDARIGDLNPGAIPQVGWLYADDKGKLRYVSDDDVYALIRNHTAFLSLNDLLASAAHGYRPSIDVRESEKRKLADIYDSIAISRGMESRAYRYGSK